MRHLTALALALGLLACDPRVGHVYWRFGDSIETQMGEQLGFFAGAREKGDAFVDAGSVPGYALACQGQYFIRRLASLGKRLPTPDGVVIALGTNDIRNEGPCWTDTWALMTTPEQRTEAIDAVLATLPPSVPVVWVVPTAQALEASRAVELQSSLEWALTTHPNLTLIYPAPGSYVLDDVHLSPTGEVEVAAEVVSTLDAEVNSNGQ